jgi:hypothetical protein
MTGRASARRATIEGFLANVHQQIAAIGLLGMVAVITLVQAARVGSGNRTRAIHITDVALGD